MSQSTHPASALHFRNVDGMLIKKGNFLRCCYYGTVLLDFYLRKGIPADQVAKRNRLFAIEGPRHSLHPVNVSRWQALSCRVI